MKLINLKRNETALREAMDFIDWMTVHEPEYSMAIARSISYDERLRFFDRMREARVTREKLLKELVG
jgi:hypothetical protein